MTIRYLVDLDIASSTGVAVNLRYSTGTTITAGGSTYTGKIAQPAFLSQSIAIDSGLGGAISSSIGELILTNTKRDLDVYKDHIFEGKTLTLYSYDTVTAIRTKLLVQVIEQAAFEWNQVSIRLQNRSATLDKPLQTLKYTGLNVLPGTTAANTLEGVTDLKDKLKPLIFGRVSNMTPVLVNTSRLIYQISSGTVEQVVNVLTNGAYLSRSANVIASYADFVSDLSTKAPAGGYYTSYTNSEGSFIRIGMSTGQLTCTVWEKKSVLANSPAQVILRILTSFGYTSADYVSADFTLLDSKIADNVGIVVQDNETIASILTSICTSIGAWWGVDQNNLFRIYYFGDLTATPIVSIHTQTSPDAFGITSFDFTGASYNGQVVPVRKVSLQYDKNWSVQNKESLAGIVVTENLERANWLSTEYRSAVVESPTTLTLFPTSQVFELSTVFDSEIAALSEATRVLNLTSVKRNLVNLSVRLSLAELASLYICSIINVILPRYGIAGTSYVLTSMEIDYLNYTANLTLWG